MTRQYISPLTSIIIGVGAVILCTAQFVPPLATVEPLHPAGLRVSIPDEDGITLMAIHAKINEEFDDLSGGTISRDIIKKRKNNRWTYEDRSTRLKVGDVLYYWIHVIKDGLGYNLLDQQHQVTKFYTYDGRLYVPNTPVGTVTVEPRGTCIPSTTTVNGDPKCAGELLFEENFDRLQTNRWRIVKQFPNSPESEFVIYQSHEENLSVKDGELQVRPSLVEHRYSENFVKHGNMTLESCTGQPGTKECQHVAVSYKYVPPVFSSLIDTRQSFSFQYGRVEIRAKLPQGDWLYPVLTLHPLDDVYGSGYDSGVLKIACTSGNRNLRSKTNANLDGTQLRAGAVVSLDQDIRYNTMSHKSSTDYWGDDYHVYELRWTASRIIVKVDGTTYGEKVNPAKPYETQVLKGKNIRWFGSNAPFDKPFFLRLGVAVGGFGEFPDGCTSRGFSKPWKNTDPKAVLGFFNAKGQWANTWESQSSALKVDYVRVWAL